MFELACCVVNHESLGNRRNKNAIKRKGIIFCVSMPNNSATPHSMNMPTELAFSRRKWWVGWMRFGVSPPLCTIFNISSFRSLWLPHFKNGVLEYASQSVDITLKACGAVSELVNDKPIYSTPNVRPCAMRNPVPWESTYFFYYNTVNNSQKRW